jgi:hypothetical protein
LWRDLLGSDLYQHDVLIFILRLMTARGFLLNEHLSWFLEESSSYLGNQTKLF